MSRRKSEFPSKRFRLDGYIRMQAVGETLDPRDQKFHDWLFENRGQAAGMARQIITSMLHGELGSHVQKAVEAGNTQETIEALQDLIGAFSEV